MIVIVDYGLGNLTSVKNAFDKLNINSQISSDPQLMRSANGLILPGVGAAREGMKNLKKRGLDKLIREQAKIGKPILGICLGMQLLLNVSEEGDTVCLGIIDGKANKFNTTLKVPQIGWNQVKIAKSSPLFKNIADNSYFYFVNSFYCKPFSAQAIIGATEYGEKFCSVLQQDNIFGVQFHPEKSSDTGLQLLKNFWEVIC